MSFPELEKSDAPDRRYVALAEINLADQVSAGDVLNQVAELATELLPASLGASAVLAHPEDGFVVVASTVPGQPEGLHTDSHGTTRRIYETGEPAVVGDVDAGDTEPSALAREFGVKAFAGVPIAMDRRRIGVLYVLDSEPRQYTDDDIEFLEMLAGRGAAALHHAEVFSEMRSARERSEALAWVANAVIAAIDLDEVLDSVVEGVAAAVAAHESEIVTVDSSLATVVSYARSGFDEAAAPIDLDGIAGESVVEARVLVEEGSRAVAAPLRAGNSVLGSLVVRRAATESGFTEEEIDLIVAMANQAAIAIDNVRLLDATRSTLRETEAMYEMSQALVAGGDLPELLDAIAAGLMTAVPAAGARVLMADSDELTAQATAGEMDDDAFSKILSGDVGNVLRTGAAVRKPSSMVVPLAVHGRLLGALEAVNPDDGPQFDDDQYGTLRAVGAQAAVALENHLLFGEVQRLAITDELTGVNSRRHLFELGQREFAKAIRFRRPLSAIMFDLDHFKGINDTLGHLAGDEVLAGVAGRCHDVLREVDVLGRYGGEEFAIILPDASSETAQRVAERVREAIAVEPIETARGPVAVTVSLGVAEIGPGVLDLKTLLDKADVAMYAAKSAGRNQVSAA